MSHSVVKVTDSTVDDSLLLLVGEDGTVTPDRKTVERYLSLKTGSTNIQVMHINRTDEKSIEASIDDLTYCPDSNFAARKPVIIERDMDKISHSLYSFKLDHDYTPLTSPKRHPPDIVEEDELAHTLSLLDGVNNSESIIITGSPVLSVNEIKPTVTTTTKTKLIPLTINNVVNSTTLSPVTNLKLRSSSIKQTKPTVPVKAKPVVEKPSKPLIEETQKEAEVVLISDEDDESFTWDDDIQEDDSDNDSDFEIEEVITKPKPPVKTMRNKKLTKSESVIKTQIKSKAKIEKQQAVVVVPPPVVIVKPPEVIEQPPSAQDQNKIVTTEKKPPPKKEKKPPKPIPDDFALFSTPDIIRRVGGKEPTTPVTTTPSSSSQIIETIGNNNQAVKPAKIFHHDSRSKSTSDLITPMKHTRSSIDHQKDKEASNNHHRLSTETKQKPKQHTPHNNSKLKRSSVDENKLSRSMFENNVTGTTTTTLQDNTMQSILSLPQITTSEDLNNMIADTSILPNLSDVNVQQGLDPSGSGIETSGLDLDQTLLDNISNDLISEDILYQVAQSLVANTDLQNAIDKSINEGSLLDPTLQQSLVDPELHLQPTNLEQICKQPDSNTTSPRGTQIVRPDGRIVVIPPIERPTTRSRNKKQEEPQHPVFKTTHKPLDEEHVSGNELDSSGEEEESEDDPHKLWCICNQPHNNRFMICCDTCEEWYHGKCVNITKIMGQQMEAEGKEWICLFCRDNKLKRPVAAAKRIRKASRASRASSDSTGSSKKGSETTPTPAVLCLVCQKPARNNSIFCSELCILAHAKTIEKVVVFERSSGKMLTGSKAPSAANLQQWLKEHPGYEVVRSTGQNTPSKQQQLTQTKLKIVKNTQNEGTSLQVNKKGVNVGTLKHLPKHPAPKSPVKGQITGFKIISKHQNINHNQQQQPHPQHQQKNKIEHNNTTTPTKPSPVLVQKKIVPTPKTPTTNANNSKADKPIPVKTPKSRQSEPTPPQPKQQENIRENVQKTLFEQLTNRLKLSNDLKLSEEDVKNISNEIELQLYKCFGDTGQKYRNKYRSLIFNIKDVKNQTLWRRICEKSVNPYQLVRLSSDDLASQELALWREREAKHQLDMIKKSELELLNCNRQYVLKTHKGEQILEDNRPTDRIDNTDVIKSLTEGSNVDSSDGKQDSKKDRDKKGLKHSHKDRDKKSKIDHKSRRSTSRDRSRRRSRSKDHSSRHSGSDKKKSRSRDRSRHKRSSHKSSRHRRDSLSYRSSSTTDKLDKKSKEILEQLVDSKIVPPLEDRLWKHVPQDDIIPASIAESDSDHEPTSTVTIPTPPRTSDTDEFSGSQSYSEKGESKEKASPTAVADERSTSPPLKRGTDELWRGTINMIDVAQISITAHEVSGDCSGLGGELPPNLDIVGRISPETVWDYIGKMKCSNSKIISLVRLNAINIEEKMPYLALYSYLSSRNRLGVVKSTNKAVKDFYILPLASQKPIPQSLLPLNGPGFEESRPALLLGIIVRDKRKRPLFEAPPTTPVASKRLRAETPPLPPQRSYTPPPSKDSKTKLPLPTPVPPLPATKVISDDVDKEDDDGDEPYSPEDSDPDISAVASETSTIVHPIPNISFLDSNPSETFQSFTPNLENIPGLESPVVLSSNTEAIESHLAEIDKKIAESKNEINSISQNIVTASTEIGSSALANIALPSNLQQILDSIKTIVPAGEDAEALANKPETSGDSNETDLTIPLMLPNKFSRPLSTNQTVDLTSDTIPLKLPRIKKASRFDSPLDVEKSTSVLSSLSEEDLIRKAEEMLGETSDSSSKDKEVTSSTVVDMNIPPPTIVKTMPLFKKLKTDLSQPPVPGLEDELLQDFSQ